MGSDASLFGLALATAAFVGSHLILSHPLRTRLVGALTERGFLGLYSIVSLLTFGWMILAWRGVNQDIPYWVAPDWWWPVAAAILLLASILLVGSFVRNPAFPHPGTETWKPPAAKGVFAITRHPMNWAFLIWAMVHISLWGSAQNLIVAGGIAILALAGSIGQDRKKRAVIGPPWSEWEKRTSFVPFGGLLAGRVSWRAAAPGATALLGGLAFWLVVTWLHAPSVSPIAMILGG
jgi:uncharacterized membrane protein